MGEMVIEVTRANYPEALLPLVTSLDRYAVARPELVPLNTTEDTVMEVGHWISGGVGTGGMEAFSLLYWIL